MAKFLQSKVGKAIVGAEGLAVYLSHAPQHRPGFVRGGALLNHRGSCPAIFDDGFAEYELRRQGLDAAHATMLRLMTFPRTCAASDGTGGLMYEPREPTPYNATRAYEDRHQSELTRDVAFNRHSMNDGHHVSPYDNARIVVGDDEIVVQLVQGLDMDSLKRVLSKATRATIGIDLRAYDEDDRDWEEMMEGGLQTALESQVIVFEVSGVSRASTHQIVRTRKAAFHQQSMRASFYGVQPEFRMPESIWNLSNDVREKWATAVRASHEAYAAACAEDASYQDARYILPEGTTNYIMCEYTLREFMNVYAYRGCSMFQWEIVSVMRAMRQILVGKYPWLDKYIRISCEQTRGSKDTGLADEWVEQNPHAMDDDLREAFAHTCTFQGWEQVEGQCSFPWARDTNRTFTSKLHTIGK
jgi:flavin-dependent thymidylate synthase